MLLPHRLVYRSSLDDNKDDTLDHVSRENVWRAAARRALGRFLSDFPAQEQMLEATQREKSDFGEEEARLQTRLFESTFHPSQILTPKLKESFFRVVSGLRQRWRDERDAGGEEWSGWDTTKIEAEVEQSMRTIIECASAQETRMSNAYSPSNGLLAHDQIEYLHHKINDTDIPNVDEDASKYNRVYDAMIDEFASSIRVNERPFDETTETIMEAKDFLLANTREIHPIWIDFDGAKRPEGVMFSIYAGLIMEDIRHFGNERQRAATQETYHAFVKNDAIIHALTQILQVNGIPEAKKSGLEKMMNRLKERRKESIEELVIVRNSIEGSRRKRDDYDSADAQPRGVWLSKQIRFMPRIDHAFVETLKKWQTLEPEIRRKSQSALTKWEETDEHGLLVLEHILQQIVEINEISQDTRGKGGEPLSRLTPPNPLVPQIMIAEAEDQTDVNALLSHLRHIQAEYNARQKRHGHKHSVNNVAVTRKIGVVPLFEQEGVTSPQSIRQYLEDLWEGIDGEDDEKRNTIRLNYGEIFFAGSDLSKRMGQLAALNQVRIAAEVIERFNAQRGTDIRIKLGSGEALFRQLGFIDPEAGLPLIRGRIATPKNDADEAVKTQQQFLTEHFGAEWEGKLARQPSGYHWLLERFPWINSFTLQSRGRERALFIEPPRLVELINSLQEMHTRNFGEGRGARQTQLKEMSDEGFEQYLAAGGECPALAHAAAAEKATYQSVMGKSTKDETTKPGGYRSLPALLQLLSKNGVMLRDRGLARSNNPNAAIEGILKLRNPGIDARAIATNTSATFTFMLGLLGKGAALQTASENGTLTEVLCYIPAREFLREMKLYEQIASEMFEILADERDGLGAPELTAQLRKEWGTLLVYRPALRAELWRQELPHATDEDKTKITEIITQPELAEKLASCFVPGMRELFDDTFTSERTALMRNAFKKDGAAIVRKSCQYLSLAHELTSVLTRAIEEIQKKSETTIVKEKQIAMELLVGLQHEGEDQNRIEELMPKTRNALRRAFGALRDVGLDGKASAAEVDRIDYFLANIAMAAGRLG